MEVKELTGGGREIVLMTLNPLHTYVCVGGGANHK